MGLCFKFRVWVKYQGKMWKWGVVRRYDFSTIEQLKDHDEVIIMQCTGHYCTLNDTIYQIYEGDILYNGEFYCEVIWHDEHGQWEVKSKDIVPLETMSNNSLFTYISIYGNKSGVTGNIHENPYTMRKEK